MNFLRLIAFSTTLLACSALASPVADTEPVPLQPSMERKRQVGVITINFENDSIGGTDRNYTNGAKLSWKSEDLSEWGQSGWRHTFLQAMSFINQPDPWSRFGFVTLSVAL